MVTRGSFNGCVAKTHKEHDGRESRFRLRLGDQSKQASDERNLSSDVPFFYPIHLSLAKHMHTLISLERVPGRLKRKEAHSWLDQPFDEAVVLFDNIIKILLLPQFTRFWNGSFRFQFVVGFGIRRI
jgi:hypothetical protein